MPRKTTAQAAATTTATRLSLVTARAVYFYGQRDPEYGYLSNFHPCHFTDARGRTFYSSEQYFMKIKQETFDPTNDALAIALLKAKAPPVAKKLGRQVQHYDDAVWRAKRLDVMVDALKLKFAGDAALCSALLATGDKQLYEASRSDAIWGIGASVAQIRDAFRTNSAFQATGDLSAAERADWFGTNLLGQALMTTRTWLRETVVAREAGDATSASEQLVDAGRIESEHVETTATATATEQ